MTVQERDDGKCIVRGVMPVPIRDDIESALVAAMQVGSDQPASVYKSWSGLLITERSNGLYDSLSSTFLWCSKPYARREIYEALRLRGTCESPYHGMVSSLQRFAGLTVCGLLAEVADRPSEFSFAFGGAVLVSRSECAARWTLTRRDFRAIKEVRGSQEAQLVKCTIDELAGLALATGLPVVTASSLYESACLDGLLQQRTRPDGGRHTHLVAPYFSSREEAQLWRREQERQLQQGQRPQGRTPSLADIKDASGFLRLSTADKRAMLRASGVRQLPRPREGPRAVDALMIPLLDEEVAYEVLRRLAETRGDFQRAAEMSDFESRKPQLARMITEARKRGDAARARELCDELNSLSTLRFDPTNPDGPGEDWDVEEWYWEQRKRVYGIIAA